ncbi:50S ribosomal protein L4 [Bienertia sinuspersici]
MGREWYLNWGTKSSSKKGRTTGGRSGGGGDSRKTDENRKGENKPAIPPTATAAAAAAAASAGGCMNAVLHLFDFQHFQLCLHPQDNSFLPDDPTTLKGVEAPRNSLESITEEEKDDHFTISKDDVEMKTNRRDRRLKLVQAPRGRVEDMASESSSSPASARTPNVVARLMGLEILPESNNTTPRSSHSQPLSSPHIQTSTPPPIHTPKTTPRSSTRRRSTDMVDHHRLSLQINNKENSIQNQMELSRPSCSAISTKRKDNYHGRNNEDEVSKSPGYYARQIMKQVKETVSRRVGVDVTNTINNRNEHRRDEHLLSSTSRLKKSSKKDNIHSSSSPKSITCTNENKVNMTISSSKPDQLVVNEVPREKTVSVQPKPLTSENERFFPTISPTIKYTTSTSSSKERLMNKKAQMKSYESIRNKKDEQFVRPSMVATTTTTTNKKGKKTILSSDLIHGTVPSLVPFKKDSCTVTTTNKKGVSSSKPASSTTTTTTATTMTCLSRYPRQRINERRREEATYAPADRVKKDATIITTAMEFQYISRILKCVGIDRDTPVSFMRWFLPSHPLDPLIFHNLEATHYVTSTSDDTSREKLSVATVNRKLIFHLVDEMLADMLIPRVKLKHHYHRHHHHNPLDKEIQQINGFQLVKILCSRIRSFPSIDCQTLQDIDALVEKDLPSFGAASNLITYQDEGEEIVSEIGSHIMDSLLQEILCLC